MKRKEIVGMGCLALTALIWGLAFVSQVQGMDSMSPLFFNATRFTLGALSLIPLLVVVRLRGSRSRAGEKHHDASGREAPMLLLGNGRKVALPAWASSSVAVGILCGLVLFSASTAQQYGVLYSRSAGRSGFITALYIVMVPLLAFAVLRRRIHSNVVLSVVLAVIGFYLLCVTDGFGSITVADLVLLASAVLFAAHILVIDTFGKELDALTISFFQTLTTAVLSWIGALAEGSVDWAGAGHAWVAVVYAGVGSVGIAYTLQVVGQRYVPPTRGAMLMSLESFFSALGGAIILGEVMTARGYLGCALIFAGTMLAQLPIESLKRHRP